MKMDILLVNPPLYDIDSEPRFPLGLGYVASVLQEDGHNIQVIDANALKLSEEQIKEMLNNSKFDIVGLTGLITQFKQVQRIASIVKNNSDTVVILGGGLATAAPEVVLKKTVVDIVVIGEGEKTVSELCQAVKNATALEEVAGICYKQDNKIFRTRQRDFIGDITSLPFPAWDLFPLERYFKNSAMCMPERRISIITSRGCPYSCTFCFHGIFGHRYRSRTAENVFQELELLYQKYHIKGFMFEDDTFVLDKDRVNKICDLIIENRLKIYWSCNARVNLVDEPLIKKLKAAGCVEISYGIESGNQAQLDKIKKGVTVEQSYRAIDLTKKAGISTHGFVMLGMPGETIETINDSIDFCKKAGLQAEFTVLTPIPGSKVYQDAVESKITKLTIEELIENWGSWLNEVLVNFTSLPEEKLIEMKRIAEKEIFNSFYKENMSYIIKLLFLEFRINGFFAVLNRLKRGLKVFVRAQKGLNLREG